MAAFQRERRTMGDPNLTRLVARAIVSKTRRDSPLAHYRITPGSAEASRHLPDHGDSHCGDGTDGCSDAQGPRYPDPLSKSAKYWSSY